MTEHAASDLPLAEPDPAAEPADGEPAPTVDGRRLRGERNKEGVIEAILDLLNEGNERPTTAEIAERSGVSVRSVFRHFDDVESLYAAAVEAHSVRMAPYYTRPLPTGDLPARIQGLVERRAELFDAMGAVRRVAERLRSTSPSIARRLDMARGLLVRDIEELFAPELARVPAEERQCLVDALEVAVSWHAWEALTRVQGCTPERARGVLARTLTALLGA